MTDLIEKKIVACYQVVDNAIKNLQSSVEDAITMFAGLYYDKLEPDDKNLITLEDFKNNVREFTIEKDPPKVLKELYIEPWLEPVWRSNEKCNWNNYKLALEAEGKEKLVAQLDADTFAILDSCYNPTTNGQWERRGLVYGHVQSGKTANYIGLANKAFDVGYKIVVIFTGMTEDLRKQTQDRVNSGIIGKNEHSEKYGIGKLASHKPDTIKGATNIFLDLNSKNIQTLITNLSLDQNIVFVVKKNVAVLNSLIKWLSKKSIAQDPNQYKIINTPSLIIDDEADNASIQSLSKKDYQLEQDALAIREIEDIDEEDLTPVQLKILEDAKKKTIKAINRNIRICLSLIAQKSFVAYTATPYAVISQRSEAIEKEWEIESVKYAIDENSDLFPEHFIIPLEPSPKYMGIEKIFGSKRKKALPVITIIPEQDKQFFPIGRSSDYGFENIPESLEDAIIHFLVTIFVRESRNQKQHNTMLVHSSHKVANIDYLANKIEKYLQAFKDEFKTNPNLKSKFTRQLELIRKNSKNELFEKHFELDLDKFYVPAEISNSNIYSIIDKVTLVSYHSKEKDTGLKHHNHKLTYPNLERDPNETRAFIVVGGNRISRGFTLEGLSTSYFVRESVTQDTLYQMGRWFGFRIGYEDTVRIYLPSAQIAWYRDILNLELELRDDLAQMNEREMTPSMWEIKMVNSKSFESLNKKLKLCDENKLRNTQRKKLSFGGTNQMTKHFKRDYTLQEANLNLTREFINSIAERNDFKKNFLYPDDTNISFINIPVSEVLAFFSKYQIHQKDEILFTVISFLNLNSSLLDSFSVVIKQKGYIEKNKVKPDWKITDKSGDVTNYITGIVRKDQGDSEDYINANLLDADRDDTFDIIDSQTITEYQNFKALGKGADYRYELRNKSKKAILIIYIIKGVMEEGKDEICFPSLYLSIPNVGESVTYTVRNK
ncbi:MAG: Z1 domain-containing protein [Ferruginibacter sp.]